MVKFFDEGKSYSIVVPKYLKVDMDSKELDKPITTRQVFQIIASIYRSKIDRVQFQEDYIPEELRYLFKEV